MIPLQLESGGTERGSRVDMRLTRGKNRLVCFLLWQEEKTEDDRNSTCKKT